MWTTSTQEFVEQPDQATPAAREAAAARRLGARFKAYVLSRLAIIGLLWAGIGAAVIAASYMARSLTPDACQPFLTFKLSRYVDETLLAVLCGGLMVTVFFLSLLERLFALTATEHRRLSAARARLWDEISGAATHLAIGTLILGIATGQHALLYTVPAYVGFGYLTFNDG